MQYLTIRQIERKHPAYRMRRRTECIRLHHSAGPEDQSPEEIWDYHVEKRGWMAGGYQFCVLFNGLVVAMRHIDAVGSHSRPTNATGVAICLVGNFYKEKPTPEQVAATARLCHLIDLRYGELPIGGHRDDNQGHTKCPGPHVVKLVKKAKAEQPSPLYWI